MTAMIDHLLDVHHMNIDANNEDLRDFFHAEGDSGTPLNCAVHYHNLPAVEKLLARGSNPEAAIYRAIAFSISKPWLPAVGPLLEAGADPNLALRIAVGYLQIDAAKICIEKGADPTLVLKRQEAKIAKQLAGCFDRRRDEDFHYACYSDEDSEDRAALREEVWELIQSASLRYDRSASIA